MSMSSEKRKRTQKVKTEITVEPPKKWKPEEMGKVYDCILQYGHKDIKKLQECLPQRSEENIKGFLRTIYDTAGKYSEKHENIDNWLKRCMVATTMEAPWRDSLQIAQVLKYLSVDGLLENHPLPEQSDGIDFRKAYRMIYQCLMGYPVQPVNKETIVFVHDTITEIINEIKSEPNIIKNVESFLIGKLKPKVEDQANDHPLVVKKPIRSYQRKTRKSANLATQTPPVKIVVESVKEKTDVGLQGYSVTVEGASNSQPVVVGVPVAPTSTPTMSKEEEELLKSLTYNPFQIPENWLREPVYQTLMKC